MFGNCLGVKATGTAMVHLIPVEMQKSVADHTRFTVVCWDLDWIVECAIFTLSSATLRCIFLFSVQSGTGKLSALFVTNESILARWGEKKIKQAYKGSAVDFSSVSQSVAFLSCRTSVIFVLLQVDPLVWSIFQVLIHLSTSTSTPFICRCILKPLCRCLNVQIKLIGHDAGSSRGWPSATQCSHDRTSLWFQVHSKSLSRCENELGLDDTKASRHSLCCTIPLSHDGSTELAQVGYLLRLFHFSALIWPSAVVVSFTISQSLLYPSLRGEIQIIRQQALYLENQASYPKTCLKRFLRLLI